MLPAFALALIVREIIPGDGMLDWVALLLGICIACIPIPVGGIFAALSHVGALALWPTIILAYTAATGHVEDVISSPIRQIFELMVWIVPIGLLILMPVRWRMGRGPESEL